MERSEYEKLNIVEDRMWWFVAMHRNLLALARRMPIRKANLPILDAGCGTGGFLGRLAQEYRDKAIFGLELDLFACTRAEAKSARPVCAGSVNEMPFRDGSFAANCLLARRLAERGVRFIQIYHRDWDHHAGVKEHVQGAASEVDRGAAALVTDLKQRGMLDETLVMVLSEHGRTPRLNNARGGGRDHWSEAYTCLFAGGGVAPWSA